METFTWTAKSTIIHPQTGEVLIEEGEVITEEKFNLLHDCREDLETEELMDALGFGSL